MAAATVLVFFSFIFAVSTLSPPTYSPCIHRYFDNGGSVCKCTSKHSDSFSKGKPLAPEHFAAYTSSKAGERFDLKIGKFTETSYGEVSVNTVVLTVDSSTKFQKILGFGGAFTGLKELTSLTDAAAMNILSLTRPLQQTLLASYFSEEGIEYTFGRIPMASCDFSTREYSYDDSDGDYALEKFALAEEDVKFKIPVIHAALNMSKREIAFLGSPWSAPAWMKTNGKMSGFGQLKGVAGNKYHKTWALYFSKFIEAYANNNITMWGLTVQNEPSTGFVPWYPWQTMGFTAKSERDFIKLDLGPTLAHHGHGNVKVMIGDDQRVFLPRWADVILGDKDAAKYVSGVAVHWYLDSLTSPSNLDETHERHPDVFILPSEACTGFELFATAVKLGDWSRGNEYSLSIIEDLTHWASGWVDWNLALNMEGGPNWVKNFVDSPIIVDADQDVFYKQPMFYHLGHFSKFVPPGSSRIAVESGGETSLQFVGFSCPDSSIVLVVLNTSDEDIPIQVEDLSNGEFTAIVPASSIQTYIWASKIRHKRRKETRPKSRATTSLFRKFLKSFETTFY